VQKQIKFFVLYLGQAQGVQIIDEASQRGVRQQRGGGPNGGSQLEGYMESWGIPTWLEYPENGTRGMRSSRHCIQVVCRAPRAWRLWVTWCRALLWVVSETDDKNRPKPDRGKGTPSTIWAPEIAKRGMFKPQRHQRERLQREPNKGMWTHQRMSGVRCKQGRSGGWVLASHVFRVVVGWVGIRVPPRSVGKPNPSHSTKYKPQSDQAERSDLAKRFFIAWWERERARERERRAGA
jgi:hypothetical protein